MASWSSLGVVTPHLGEWRLFDAPSAGGETFRLSFINLGLNPESRRWGGFGVLDSLYATDVSGSGSRVYPKVEKQIITLPIPQDLKNAGLVVRYFRVRKFTRRYLGRVNEPAWAIELEEFVP